MVARLLRDALERVPQQSRVPSLDEDVRAWSDRLARLAASTQRDPYLRQAPEILAAGPPLALKLRETPGYEEVGAVVLGLLAGLQRPVDPTVAVDRAGASLAACRAALAAAEGAGVADEDDRLELQALEAQYARLSEQAAARG